MFNEVTATKQTKQRLPDRACDTARPVDIRRIDSIGATNLAKATRTCHERSMLAAKWVNGRLRIDQPTIALAAAVFGCSNMSVSRALDQHRIRPARPLDLMAHYWELMSADERASFGLAVGVDELWDGAIAPNT